MELFLMVLCMSVFGLAITAVAFSSATRPDTQQQPAKPAPEPVMAIKPGSFFSDTIAAPVLPAPRVPVEALLLQIENHVRLEQAAAESFVASPTAALLHGRTISTLVH